jgi:hypothetical protein
VQFIASASTGTSWLVATAHDRCAQALSAGHSNAPEREISAGSLHGIAGPHVNLAAGAECQRGIQRMCQAVEIDQTHIPLAAHTLTHVGPVEPSHIGQLLLRVTAQPT